MTRFELAGILSNKLYMLTDSEKHNIIDKYVTEINMKIEEGMDETQAVAELGDIELLADRILARHHIDTSRIAPQQPVEEVNEEPEAEKISAAETIAKAGETVKETAGKASAVAMDAAAKAGDAMKDMAEKAGDVTKKTAGVFGRAAKWLGKGTVNFTFTLVNMLLFIIVLLPAILLTALAVICTVAAIVIHLFTGVGFWGINIAGIGCCLVGVSFCFWMINLLSGGRNNG